MDLRSLPIWPWAAVPQLSGPRRQKLAIWFELLEQLLKLFGRDPQAKAFSGASKSNAHGFTLSHVLGSGEGGMRKPNRLVLVRGRSGVHQPRFYVHTLAARKLKQFKFLGLQVPDLNAEVSGTPRLGRTASICEELTVERIKQNFGG